MCCVPPPATRYGLEGGGGGAGYVLKRHTFIKERCILRGLPDGAVVMFGDVDVGKRKDVILAIDNYIGMVAAAPDTA